MRRNNARVLPRASRGEVTEWGEQMGNFRFYRRVSIFPGLSINLSKSGPSLTVGMRGAHVTVGYHSGAHSAHVDTPITDAQQTTAHSLAQLIVVMCIVGAIALAIALVGSIAGGK
jgi:hypothetical protein